MCSYFIKWSHTVETLYSTIYYSKYFIELNFDKSTQYVALWTHKRHPIPRPFGRAMECLLWVFHWNWPCYKGFLLYTQTHTYLLNKPCPLYHKPYIMPISVKKISIIIKIWWKFCFTIIQILEVISLSICTCYNIIAVMAYAKVFNDLFFRGWIGPKLLFHRIWILMEKSTAKYAPDLEITNKWD